MIPDPDHHEADLTTEGVAELPTVQSILEPTEARRAMHAVVAGAALGLILALWGRRRSP